MSAAARFTAGVINLRGGVVPVLDLSASFASNTTAVRKRTSIIVLERDSGTGSVEISTLARMSPRRTEKVSHWEAYGPKRSIT